MEAMHTAALVNELSAEMCRILKVGVQARPWKLLVSLSI